MDPRTVSQIPNHKSSPMLRGYDLDTREEIQPVPSQSSHSRSATPASHQTQMCKCYFVALWLTTSIALEKVLVPVTKPTGSTVSQVSAQGKQYSPLTSAQQEPGTHSGVFCLQWLPVLQALSAQARAWDFPEPSSWTSQPLMAFLSVQLKVKVLQSWAGNLSFIATRGKVSHLGFMSWLKGGLTTPKTWAELYLEVNVYYETKRAPPGVQGHTTQTDTPPQLLGKLLPRFMPFQWPGSPFKLKNQTDTS